MTDVQDGAPAVHPVALILADHYLGTTPRTPAQHVRCACGWVGQACDHPAHLAEVLNRAGLLADGTPPSADSDLLAQVVAELQDIYRSAVTEPETGNAWRDGYVTGYVRAMRTALTIADGTPPETPTTRVLAERARQEDDMSELDLSAGHPSPEERIASVRRDLDDTIAAWRNRRTVRSVLFAGGGWHGTLRALRPEDRSVIFVESLDEPALFSLATGTPASSEPVRTRRTQYRREEYATVDDDTVTTVEVWHHEDVAAGTPEGYRLAADAALRALASTGMIDSHTRRLR